MAKQVTKEQIERARELDLLSYLQSTAPGELVHISGDSYKLKSHDSLKLSNGKWYWWSQRIGGKTALDYLVKVEGMSFPDAVEQLAGAEFSVPRAAPAMATPAPEKRPLKLPERSETAFHVIAYLTRRGIDPEIIRQCLQDGSVYESAPYHSAVFTGRDGENTIRYAAWRATADRRMMGDCSGSDKRYSFRLGSENAETVHFFESAIDALSYATLLKKNGRNWQAEALVSLSGIAANREQKLPPAAEQYLKTHPQTRQIYLRLDADEPGRNAARAMQEALKTDYAVYDVPPPKGKDYNDFLRDIPRKKDPARDGEAR